MSSYLSGDNQKPIGIAFEETEITFIYSFFVGISAFDKLAAGITKIDENKQPGHAFEAKPLANELGNKFVWRTIPHPERRGLTPSFDFAHRPSGGEGASGCDEIYCAFTEESKIELVNCTGPDCADGPGDDDIRIILDGLKLIARLGRNGMGTVSFSIPFDARRDALSRAFPKEWRERQEEILDQIGALPFIFGITNLARNEHEIDGNSHAPQSKIRRLRSASVSGKGAAEQPEELISLLDETNFMSLHAVFDNFYNKILRQTVHEILGRSEVEWLDTQILEEKGAVERAKEQSWQSPYVVISAEVDQLKSCVKQPHPAAAQAWWYQEYSNKLFELPKRNDGSSYKRLGKLFRRERGEREIGTEEYLGDKRSQEGQVIRIWQCYKEAVMLLLRLYQWRDILGLDEYFTALKAGDEHLRSQAKPHWRRVLVTPALLEKNHYGRLFKDVDLVWDTRFLMLYHERSTFILNFPAKSGPLKNGRGRGGFRTLFKQSLMRTLEGVRGQLHASVVLNLHVDRLIEDLATGLESAQDDKLMREIQIARAALAKVLRDPNDMATDAGALSIVRKRAQNDYGMRDRYRLLKSKFTAMSQLYAGQAELADIRSIKVLLSSDKPESAQDG